MLIFPPLSIENVLYKCLPTTLTHDGGVLPPFLTHDGKFCLDLSKWKKNLSKTLSPTKNHETRAYTYMTIHIGVAARRRRASLRHPDMNSHIGMGPSLMVFVGFVIRPTLIINREGSVIS